MSHIKPTTRGRSARNGMRCVIREEFAISKYYKRLANFINLTTRTRWPRVIRMDARESVCTS